MSTTVNTSPSRREQRKPALPLEPGFFADDDPSVRKKIVVDRSMPRLRDLYPEELDAYYDLFVGRCDRRAYNTKRGYWESGEFDAGAHEWRPKRKRHVKADESPYIPATRDTILADLQRHLDTAYWRSRGHRARGWRQPFFVGTLGGKFTSAFHFDIDNHGGQRIHYTRDGGNYRVPDLSVGFLRLVQRVLDLPYEEVGLKSTNLTTSSDSLGLYLWFVADIPVMTAEGHAKLRKLADDNGLVGLEVYPMPSRGGAGPYDGRSVSRLPCGHGAVTLTADGIIRCWREQVRNFLDPRPLPTMRQIADQLLVLWLESHQAWMPSFLSSPTLRLDHYNLRVAEIRSWLSDGCPRVDVGVAEITDPSEQGNVAAKEPSPAYPKCRLPEEWAALSYPDKLHAIATGGCPAGGMLNVCLIMLARHLMQYELNDLDSDEKEAVAFSVMETWCLSRHNGCSGRLSPGDTVLPRSLASVIRRDIQSVSCCQPSPVVENTLRVRDLITGEGQPNRYVPRLNTEGGGRDLLSVYTFENENNLKEDYQKAEGHLIETIRSGKFDCETIKQVEDKIAKAKPAFQRFVRRVTNFLMTKDNQTAKIHTNLFIAMAGTSSPTTATKYKQTAISLHFPRLHPVEPLSL